MPVLWAYAPDLRGWLTPHGREALDGRPFGDGTPPPPPPPPAEVVPAEHAPLAGGGAAAWRLLPMVGPPSISTY